jgi:uncharacterized membrane protein YkoI
MSVLKFLATAAFALALQAPASAAPRQHCLTAGEQRAAIAEGRAVSLATARRNLRYRMAGDLVRVRLCQDGAHLVYMLTVLPRDGKVKHATIDANNGAVVSVR